LAARPKIQSTRFFRHQSNTSGQAIMAVDAQQDLDLWPMVAQGADQTAHKAVDLDPARPLAGPQWRGYKTALRVEHNDRLEAVIVVVGVEPGGAGRQLSSGPARRQNRQDRAALRRRDATHPAQQGVVRAGPCSFFHGAQRQLAKPEPRPSQAESGRDVSPRSCSVMRTSRGLRPIPLR